MTGTKILTMFNKVGGGSVVYAHAKYPPQYQVVLNVKVRHNFYYRFSPWKQVNQIWLVITTMPHRWFWV